MIFVKDLEYFGCYDICLTLFLLLGLCYLLLSHMASSFFKIYNFLPFHCMNENYICYNRPVVLLESVGGELNHDFIGVSLVRQQVLPVWSCCFANPFPYNKTLGYIPVPFDLDQITSTCFLPDIIMMGHYVVNSYLFSVSFLCSLCIFSL